MGIQVFAREHQPEAAADESQASTDRDEAQAVRVVRAWGLTQGCISCVGRRYYECFGSLLSLRFIAMCLGLLHRRSRIAIFISACDITHAL